MLSQQQLVHLGSIVAASSSGSLDKDRAPALGRRDPEHRQMPRLFAREDLG